MGCRGQCPQRYCHSGPPCTEGVIVCKTTLKGSVCVRVFVHAVEVYKHWTPFQVNPDFKDDIIDTKHEVSQTSFGCHTVHFLHGAEMSES